MPFRKGYAGVYDQTTLAHLQVTLEQVWLAITDNGVSVSREDIARLIIAAYEAGVASDRIKEQVLAGILRPILQSSSASSINGVSADSQKSSG
jgi:chemotaxis protein histidine kinase CheA